MKNVQFYILEFFKVRVIHETHRVLIIIGQLRSLGLSKRSLYRLSIYLYFSRISFIILPSLFGEKLSFIIFSKYGSALQGLSPTLNFA